MDHDWPDRLPDDCPPDEAEAADGRVFRIVKADPPTADDFRSVREQQPRRKVKDECQACGLSVFGAVDDATDMRDAIPAFRGRLIAEGELSGEMGVMKPTPRNGNTHITWWTPEGLDPSPAFAVVESGGAS